MSLTTAEIEEAKKLCEGATPGPDRWLTVERDRFIAAARSSIPRLVAMVEQLTKEAARLRSTYEDLDRDAALPTEGAARACAALVERPVFDAALLSQSALHPLADTDGRTPVAKPWNVLIQFPSGMKLWVRCISMDEVARRVATERALDPGLTWATSDWSKRDG